MSKVIVVDYGMGNIRSVIMALESLGVHAVLSSNSSIISKSKKIILPGVGSFNSGMTELKKRGLDKSIKIAVSNGAFLLGICLGMQMIFHKSFENGITKGLNLIEGLVDRIPFKNEEKIIRKIPHIGWNKLLKKKKDWNNTILNGIDDKTFFYYVHSYMAFPKNESNIIASCDYMDLEIPSVVIKDKIFGIQFHPENSGNQGLKIYKNFLEMNY